MVTAKTDIFDLLIKSPSLWLLVYFPDLPLVELQRPFRNLLNHLSLQTLLELNHP